MTLPQRLAMGAVVTIALLGVTACDELFGPPPITVTAEILEPDAPASVEASTVERGEDGLYEHVVRVEWRGVQPTTLDDARFTHHVRGLEGDLIIAGRGCGVEWGDARQEVMHLCTADLTIIEVAPGEVHEYPVRIHPRVGTLRLEPGTYVVEERLAWWLHEDQAVSAEPPDGEFTVRLAYEVGEPAASPVRD